MPHALKVAITSFLAGLVVVIVGAELIVRGGSRVTAGGVAHDSGPDRSVGTPEMPWVTDGNAGCGGGIGANSGPERPLPLQLLSLKLDLPVMVISPVRWRGRPAPADALMVEPRWRTIAMVYSARKYLQHEFSRGYSASNRPARLPPSIR